MSSDADRSLSRPSFLSERATLTVPVGAEDRSRSLQNAVDHLEAGIFAISLSLYYMIHFLIYFI